MLHWLLLWAAGALGVSVSRPVRVVRDASCLRVSCTDASRARITITEA